MSEDEIVDSSFTATIHAPLEKIDIPAWCFSLSEKEYQGCSPAHLAAGFTHGGGREGGCRSTSRSSAAA